MALHSWIVQLVERAAVNRDAFKESGVRVPLQERNETMYLKVVIAFNEIIGEIRCL